MVHFSSPAFSCHNLFCLFVCLELSNFSVIVLDQSRNTMVTLPAFSKNVLLERMVRRWHFWSTSDKHYSTDIQKCKEDLKMEESKGFLETLSHFVNKPLCMKKFLKPISSQKSNLLCLKSHKNSVSNQLLKQIITVVWKGTFDMWWVVPSSHSQFIVTLEGFQGNGHLK